MRQLRDNEHFLIIGAPSVRFDGGMMKQIVWNAKAVGAYTDCGGNICGGELGSICDACMERDDASAS